MSDTVKSIDKKPKKNGLKKSTRFFKDLMSEIKKVVWPSKKQTINNTLVVIVVMLIAGAFVWGLDSLLTFVVRLILQA
jgi:preprotein translocase subunit SecE